MSFYQKYRSEKVADLDLTSVRSAFESMMSSGQVAHAYLFVGPRGLGKTSAARILARMVNCERNLPHPPAVTGVPPLEKGRVKMNKLEEPCGECSACISIKNGSAVDVMEIDAASHRGIDDIRDLREKVNLAPSILPKKVYIIDEVHMLTTEAFNALLKTLEEPPAHVMFILCTTEAHKVPETIMSRCVRVNFTKATTEELIRSLKRAVEGENLKAEEGVLEELASGLDGSFREGHKLLEQLANRFPKISVESVRETLKLIGSNQVESILEAVRMGRVEEVVAMMKQTEADGVDVVSLVTKLLASLKVTIREKILTGEKLAGEIRLVRGLIKAAPKIRTSPLPLLPLELVLEREAMRNNKPGSWEAGKLGIGEDKKETPTKSPPSQGGEGVVDFERVVAGWHDLLTHLAPRNHSVAGLLRSARPKEIKDKFLIIEVFYKFHKDQLDQDARRKIIEEEIAKMWGPISVKCVLGSKVKTQELLAKPDPALRDKNSKTQEAESNDDIKAAEEVFGG